MDISSSVGDGSFEHPQRSVQSIVAGFEWYDKKNRELTEENKALRAQIEKLQPMNAPNNTKTAPAAFSPAPCSARPCPACGRETKEPTECLVCQSERLLRASPYLMAACQAVVAQSFYSGNTGYQHVEQSAISLVRAAIEKAKNP